MPTGLSLLTVSLLTELSITIEFPFFILGIVYMVIGSDNRNKLNKKMSLNNASHFFSGNIET